MEHLRDTAKCYFIDLLKPLYIRTYVHMHTYTYKCILYNMIILHIDILPGGITVGPGPTDDDVAIWCTLTNKYIRTYLHAHSCIDMYKICMYVLSNLCTCLSTYVRTYESCTIQFYELLYNISDNKVMVY